MSNRKINGMLDKIFMIINKPTVYSKDVVKCFNNVRKFNKELLDHSLNVSFLSMILGINNLESEFELQELFIAALLHDYGKIYIPRSILDKADALTPEERQTIDLHTIVGSFYLRRLTNLDERILNGILDHHEKLDGSGYGLCKKSKYISKYAKIITIADVYDAMVSDRVYRKSLPREAAVEYLRSNANNYFDLSLVEQFISITNNMNIKYLERKFRENLMILHPQAV